MDGEGAKGDRDLEILLRREYELTKKFGL